ncbi:hypothetical protein DE4585_02865 [Mycobacteroides salmoniphilum]|uniref:Uncharacterized protein n=1 Tax=Mycobacteroides salmoniphilum TaxID=404941 RepID=A0A4R8RXD6_9MYCO|nr:hypothetical protein DE4585_02865 [Mycobacteroides salmoniphilum]
MLSRHLTQRRDLALQMMGASPFPLQFARMIRGFHRLARRRCEASVREAGLPSGAAFHPLLHSMLLRLNNAILMPTPVPGAFGTATTARVPDATLDSHRVQCMKFRQTAPRKMRWR